ncbi:Haloacid dehalogenase-like hydrolase domain protein [mine drainage metagenome]|uniref:Haloacid dehalogenase-like hydrolase domain protein n=1 Tax=mine drainage metagenome TaxID=410659 RepID=T1ADC1_9ZZZZ
MAWDEAVDEYDRRLALLHPLVLQGTLSSSESRRVRLRSIFGAVGLDPDPATLREAEIVYAARYHALRRSVPGSIPLLRSLRSHGLRIGVVTNHQAAPQREKLRELGLYALIDQITISEEAGAVKPEPKIFESALREASVEPSEAVMVGDSWENDVLGARRAGIRPIWFRRGTMGLPDRTVQTLRSFRPLDRARSVILTPPPGRPRRTG